MAEKQRIQKIIADSGFCSRRKAEELIKEGKVTLDGEVVKIGKIADPEKAEIRVGNQPIHAERKVYILLHKPLGYITTAGDKYGRKKVTDLVQGVGQRIFPVGRLDRDASGLLLLTNDGEWGNRIMHPRYGTEKEYLVQLEESLPKDMVKRLNGTVRLKDGKVEVKTKQLRKDLYSVVVHEGRHKIVKRLFQNIGVRVRSLKRTRVGPYTLGRLKPGQWLFIEPKKTTGKTPGRTHVPTQKGARDPKS